MPGGRPTKRTEDVEKRLAEAIRMGATYKLACAYAGLTFETFNEWRKDDPSFSDRMRLAEGECALAALKRIEDRAKEGNLAADTWLIERRWPQDYGRHVTELQGKDGSELKFSVTWPTAKANVGEA